MLAKITEDITLDPKEIIGVERKCSGTFLYYNALTKTTHGESRWGIIKIYLKNKENPIEYSIRPEETEDLSDCIENEYQRVLRMVEG